MSSKTRYYALDGQHRLLAIKELLNPAGEFVGKEPRGFAQETMAVCLVVPHAAEGIGQFRERFRRLFGHLNRYAKKMDDATNVIMDEDDAVAICLRRLFSDHEFFKTVGPDRDSLRVITYTSSKNIPPGAIHLTSIVTLYDLCLNFLASSRRLNALQKNATDFKKEFLRFRPEDQVLDEMYAELSAIWDGVLEVFPELNKSGVEMRDNNVTDVPDAPHQNHLLFRPIGQIAFSNVVRALLNAQDKPSTTKEDVVSAITPLRTMNFDMGSLPWRHLVWVNVESGDVPGATIWKISEKSNRSELKKFIETLMLAHCGGGDIGVHEAKYRELVTPPANEQLTVDDLWHSFNRLF